jgi:hypothetical protein
MCCINMRKVFSLLVILLLLTAISSMFLDPRLWLQVRKTALDLGVTATKFVEEALTQRLEDAKEAETRLQAAETLEVQQ